MFKCSICSESFSRKQYMARHQKEIHEGLFIMKYTLAQQCKHKDCSPNLPEITKDGITRSISANVFGCTVRYIRFAPTEAILPEELLKHGTQLIEVKSPEIVMKQGTQPTEVMLPEVFFKQATNLIEDTLQILRDEEMPCKINTLLCVQLFNYETSARKDSYLTVAVNPLECYDINLVIKLLLSKVHANYGKDSSWFILHTHFVELHVNKYYR